MSRQLFVIALCLCSLFVASKAVDRDSIIAKIMAAADVCRTDVGASDTDIQDMISKQPASTNEGKCLRACLMKKFEIMDSNGKFVKSVANEHAKKYTDNDPEKMKIATEIGDACEAIQVSDDHCEAAEQYLKCFKEQVIARGLDKYEF